jgi:DNA-binding transcriptional LysR family regulator
LAKGELVELLPGYLSQTMGIYGIYTSRRQMPATLRTMLDFLVEWFATDPGWRATLR